MPFFVGRKIALASVTTLVIVVFLYFLRPAWQLSGFGNATHIESLDADLFFLDAGEVVERGPSRVLVLRFDGPIRLVPFHYRGRFGSPVPIDQWQVSLGLPVVFNAGQYDENDVHLGWLKGEGAWISRAYRKQWKALLVSQPAAGPAWSGIIDLKSSNPDVAQSYHNVVQSMMLVDRVHGVRVRESERTACRTVVAQDGQGRLMLILTEGAVTLAAFGRWLTEQPSLEIVRAMNLDGGLESQAALKTEDVSMTLFGQYGTGTFDATAGPFRRPLPAVIGILPIKDP